MKLSFFDAEARRRGESPNRLFSAPPRLRVKCLAPFLVLCMAISAHATTFYVTIAGLGGEADYKQRCVGERRFTK